MMSDDSSLTLTDNNKSDLNEEELDGASDHSRIIVNELPQKKRPRRNIEKSFATMHEIADSVDDVIELSSQQSCRQNTESSKENTLTPIIQQNFVTQDNRQNNSSVTTGQGNDSGEDYTSGDLDDLDHLDDSKYVRCIPVDSASEKLFEGDSSMFKNITLQELRHMQCLKSVHFVDVQILRILVQPRGANGNNYAYTYANNRGRNNNRGQSRQVNYSRLILVRIMNETESDRIAYIMEARGSNQELWNRSIELRDNGTVTIGTVLRLLSPRPIQNFMANNVPLLCSHYPALILKNPPIFLHVSIKDLVETNASFAFCENFTKLSISPVYQACRTSCSGLFCDRQRLADWTGDNERGCGCYAMHHRRSSIAFQHDIVIENLSSRPGREITMDLFSSNKFSKLYLSDHLSPSVQLPQLDLATEEFFELMNCIKKVIKYVNENGGFTVIGWYKRGTINDRTLVNPTTSNSNNTNDQEQVDAGEVNYRIVELSPTNKNLLDESSEKGCFLASLKYDVTKLHS